MRVTLVSQYFPPEAGATQNRLGAFAEGLCARGHTVTVVCEQPNHPAGVFQPGFGRRPVISASETGIRVHRLWVAASPHKTTARRLGFYASFAAGAAAAVAALPRADVVLASSPPLPGVLAAAGAARARRTPLVVDVRDIWPAAAQALGELSNARVIRAFERAERWLYRTAAAATATTRPFCNHIDRVAGREIAVHVPNGALDDLVALLPAPEPPGGPFVVGYAGNFGIAQGLNIALDAAELLRGEDVRFVLLGEGPLRENVLSERSRRGLEGVVEIRHGIPTAEIGAFLQSCHALLIPLRNHPLLGDFIPSKLYDAMAVGRPVLVAARGEARALVVESDAGIAVAPEDGAELAAAIRRLQGDPALRASFAKAGRAAAAASARSRQIERLEQVLTGAARDPRHDGP